MRLTTLTRRPRGVFLSAVSAITLFGVAHPNALFAQGKAEKLLVQGPIWGANDAFNGYSFLPVTIHGKAATVVVDLNCTECDLMLSDAALTKVGTTSTTATDSLTFGGVTEANIPVKHNSNPTWSIVKPDSMSTVVGIVGVHFIQRFDFVYDFPHHLVQLYKVEKQPTDVSKAWLPTGFSHDNCGPMVEIPPGAATFTGMKMQIDGKPVIGALEMGPYIPKMNENAFKLLGLPQNSPRVQAAQPGEADGHPMVAHVSGVQMTAGSKVFGTWDNEVLEEVDAQSLLPNNPPVMLMNLSMMRDVQLLNAMSSKQVCIVKP